eukprot:13652146-Alexandrium_andersonii.AAC.1
MAPTQTHAGRSTSAKLGAPPRASANPTPGIAARRALRRPKCRAATARAVRRPALAPPVSPALPGAAAPRSPWPARQ